MARVTTTSEYVELRIRVPLAAGALIKGADFGLKVDERLRPGLLVAASGNVGAIDLDAGVIAVAETDDGARRYSDAVNAPLSEATIAALNEALASGDAARYRKVRRQPAGPTRGENA